VLVDGGQARVIRRRQTVAELLALEAVGNRQRGVSQIGNGGI
jgi:hypothetical protein